MPGLATYAAHNSRDTTWQLSDPGGNVIGTTRSSLRREGRGRIFVFGATTVFVRAPFRYDGSPMRAYDAANRAQTAGTMRRVDRHNPDGSLRLKNDSSGMFSLIPRRLAQYLGTNDALIRPFANVHDDLADGGTSADTRENFFQTFEGVPAGLDFFVFCGHGSPQGLESACCTGESGRVRLTGELSRLLRNGATVVFYACSTGAPGGFAQQLSRDLAAKNVAVWGHTVSGSASTNPTKVRYLRGEPFRLQDHLSARSSALWNSHRLPDRLYLLAPFLTLEQLEHEIAGVA